MYFNVAGLLKDEVGASRSYRVENGTIRTGGDVFASIHGPVKMLRTDLGILVEARIEALTPGFCSRCLAPVDTELSTEIEDEYYPANSVRGGWTDDDLEPWSEIGEPVFAIDEKNILDLSEAVRQALVSALPMAPLCSPDCRGICPQCAADRNEVACDCA